MGWGFFWTTETLKQSGNLGRFSQRLHFSERATFAEIFCKRFPINSALEVGSAYGQSFHILAKLFPQTQFYGIEPSPESVKYGQILLEKEKLLNVKMICQGAENLSQFKDRSIDIVFSSAALLYLSPEAIKKVIREMIRICRRSIILLELHQENPYFENQDGGVYLLREQGLSGYWVRDYAKLIKSILPKAEVKLTKIKSALWEAEPWKDMGYVIEVDLI